MGIGKKITLAALASLLFSSTAFAAKPVKVRIGHFPNITHAQALLAHAEKTFEAKFAPGAEVEWKVFNAGPSAVEALFAGQLDITVIGPSPAINAYVKSGGEAVRVVSGSASGGAALVVRGGLDIQEPQDFKKKKIASPQLGNTQDVALRSWLAGSGLKLKEKGGDVQVLTLSNADQETLFLKKEIDAAWAVEPWVSMLVQKAGGRIFLDEADLWAGGKYSTALILVRKKFLDEHPELVKKFLEAHVEMTEWIQAHPDEAKKILREEIKKETGKEVPQNIMDAAFPRLKFSYEPLAESVLEQAHGAYKAGFLKEEPDLSELFSLDILEDILKKKGVQPEWTLPVPLTKKGQK